MKSFPIIPDQTFPIATMQPVPELERELMMICPYCGHPYSTVITVSCGSDKYYDVFQCRSCSKSYLLTQAALKPFDKHDIH
ncbi:MAG TPA: hypothetical protein DDW42_05225 [Desulfobacteraceae bacterium]|nr:hypothetical protein [Desulfobacteraceae bacterium]